MQQLADEERVVGFQDKVAAVFEFVQFEPAVTCNVVFNFRDNVLRDFILAEFE